VGENNAKAYATLYNKKLFGTLVPNSFLIMEGNNHDIKHLSDQEIGILTTNFTE
jgi:hypothetical protein